MSVLFELEPLPIDDSRHSFVLLADPQIGWHTEVQEFKEVTGLDLSQTLSSLGDIPTFGIGCGDLVNDRLELLPAYESVVSGLGIPFFQVKGNHDLDIRSVGMAAATTFMDRYGPTYYSFDRGDVHYVVLDDVDWFGNGAYRGYIPKTQLDWLRSDLKRIEPGRVVVIVTHIPFFSTIHLRYGWQRPSAIYSVENREELYDILDRYQVHVLSAHMHEHEHVFEGKVHEHVHASVCGAWWTGPICSDGTPKGYTLYDVNGESLSWRYKAAGHPFDHQLRIYPPGADPARPGDFVINVWDWDPRWEVSLYSQGLRVGSLLPEIGLDPLANRLMAGDSRPSIKQWVEPVLTRHLFYVDATRHGSDLTVEVRDRFGNVYHGKLIRDSQQQVPV